MARRIAAQKERRRGEDDSKLAVVFGFWCRDKRQNEDTPVRLGQRQKSGERDGERRVNKPWELPRYIFRAKRGKAKSGQARPGQASSVPS